jgi:hypothetical protein
MEYLEEYRKLAAAQGGELLSQAWLGTRFKLDWRCAKGHERSALPSNVREGCWCCAEGPEWRASLKNVLRRRSRVEPGVPTAETSQRVSVTRPS